MHAVPEELETESPMRNRLARFAVPLRFSGLLRVLCVDIQLYARMISVRRPPLCTVPLASGVT
jgi:hypothetical protein